MSEVINNRTEADNILDGVAKRFCTDYMTDAESSRILTFGALRLLTQIANHLETIAGKRA